MELFRKCVNRYKQSPLQARAALWFFICSFLQKAITSITTPIFTRLLSSAEYGQYSVFNSWLSIVTIFVTLNLNLGVYMQGLVKFGEEKNKYSSSLQGLCLTLVSIWTVIYLLFHDFWNGFFTLTTVQMLAMLIMIWTTAAFGFWSGEQRVEQRYRGLVAVTVIVSVAKPVIGIIFVLHAEDKVTARILGLALVEIIAYTGMFFKQMRQGKCFFSRRFWKYALMFNLPLIPHYLSMSVLSSADRIMISRMVGDAEAGIYNLAYSVSLIMTMFNTALLRTIEPWLYKKIKAKRLDRIAGIAYPTFIVIAAVNIILIAFAPEVVAIFAPRSYYDAIWVIPPVAMSVYFTYAYSFFATIEFYYEKTGYVAAASTIGALLNVVLNALFIPIFGYYAAGYTTLFCYILYALFHYLFSRKICKDYFDNKQAYDIGILLLITAVFMASGFLLLLTYRLVWVRYSLILGAGCLVLWKRKLVLEIAKRIMNIKNDNRT